MNDPVLAAIGDDLQRAVRRRAVRRRRRRLALTVAACTAALATVTGAVAGDVDPLTLVPDFGAMAPPAHDVQRIDLTVDGRADPWHVILYRSQQGALCVLQVPGDRRVRGIGCGAGFAIASDPGMRRAGLASIGFFGSAHGRRLIAGAVAADVERVVLTDGTGRRYPATLSSQTIAIPVIVERHALTPSGRRLAADLPRRLVLRGYAAELPWSRGRVLGAPRVRFQLHRADGTVRTAAGPPTSG